MRRLILFKSSLKCVIADLSISISSSVHLLDAIVSPVGSCIVNSPSLLKAEPAAVKISPTFVAEFISDCNLFAGKSKFTNNTVIKL
uniref:Putative secreted protein n=1 Tax=Lutzomyia longipalpis TaxID=7200 RepID=A0A7G3AKX4_LUTLO